MGAPAQPGLSSPAAGRASPAACDAAPAAWPFVYMEGLALSPWPV